MKSYDSRAPTHLNKYFFKSNNYLLRNNLGNNLTSRDLPESLLMSRNVWTWKLRRALLQNEEPCRAQTLQNDKSVEGVTSGEAKTSEELIIYLLIRLHLFIILFWKIKQCFPNAGMAAGITQVQCFFISRRIGVHAPTPLPFELGRWVELREGVGDFLARTIYAMPKCEVVEIRVKTHSNHRSTRKTIQNFQI